MVYNDDRKININNRKIYTDKSKICTDNSKIYYDDRKINIDNRKIYTDNSKICTDNIKIYVHCNTYVRYSKKCKLQQDDNSCTSYKPWSISIKPGPQPYTLPAMAEIN